MCEICSKFTIKTPERRQGHLSGVYIVNFEHISHLFVVDFEEVNVSWDCCKAGGHDASLCLLESINSKS